MYDFRAKYKESIELDESQFITLCKFRNVTNDKKALKLILNHLQPKVIVQVPIVLNPPPITRIVKRTVTTTTTTTIERTDFTGCVNELKEFFESGTKVTIGKHNDSEVGIKSKEEIKLILDANEMVLARD